MERERGSEISKRYFTKIIPKEELANYEEAAVASNVDLEVLATPEDGRVYYNSHDERGGVCLIDHVAISIGTDGDPSIKFPEFYKTLDEIRQENSS